MTLPNDGCHILHFSVFLIDNFDVFSELWLKIPYELPRAGYEATESGNENFDGGCRRLGPRTSAVLAKARFPMVLALDHMDEILIFTLKKS